MVHPGSQWLYVITDTATQNLTNMTTFVDLLAEGGNVAFMYNASSLDGFCEVMIQCFHTISRWGRFNYRRPLFRCEK